MHRDRTAFKMSANFRATMEELKFMKKQTSLTAVKVTSPEANVSANKEEESMQTEKNISDLYSIPVKGPRGSILSKEELNMANLVEESRKAGIKYIVFPKRTHKKKSGKYISPDLVQNIYVQLQDSPRIIERLYYLNSFLHPPRVVL